jgi:hypothetical protein
MRVFTLLLTIQMKKYILDNKDTAKELVQKFLTK